MSENAAENNTLADPQAVYRELNRLTEETTALLMQVVNLRQQLQQAVDTSTTAETNITGMLAEINPIHEAAVTKLEAAVNLIDSATAVVFGGNYSVTPQAGSVPVGNADGALDAQWFPSMVANIATLQSIGAQNQNDIDKLELLTHTLDLWRQQMQAIPSATQSDLDALAARVTTLEAA